MSIYVVGLEGGSIREGRESTSPSSSLLSLTVSAFALLPSLPSEELRRRFLKAETTLFRLRFESDDAEERQSFLKALQLDWTIVRTSFPPSFELELILDLLTLSDDF